MTFLVALQWMELPAWHIHVLRALSDIQSLQLTRQLRGVRRLNARLGPSQEEAFNTLVAETLYHRSNVSRNDTRVNLFGRRFSS